MAICYHWLMNRLHFKAVMEIIGVNPYVPVSAEQAKQLHDDWRRPMPVLVWVNGKPEEPWHINMMPRGDGSFYLYLHGDIRKVSGTGVGDEVTVDVEFDESYQNGPMHPMPDWFQAALDESPKALRAWNDLIPSRQKEVLRYFDGLKSQEARERNLQKAMHVLEGNEGRFMARAWKGGK